MEFIKTVIDSAIFAVNEEGSLEIYVFTENFDLFICDGVTEPFDICGFECGTNEERLLELFWIDSGDDSSLFRNDLNEAILFEME